MVLNKRGKGMAKDTKQADKISKFGGRDVNCEESLSIWHNKWKNLLRIVDFYSKNR